ncbi:TadE family type IV pilus minor pilin [Prauserella oleivorans]|uniref:TadE family type IV pilus minor pilin n=1 Tax=Prauserella oleivorans TaxID=1478153 RepID=A0ABW5W6F9_9PSEU
MRRRIGDDRGAVTVEGAIALCSLLVLFGMVIAGVSAMAGQLRCTDAAGEAARLLGRGDRSLAEEAVRRLAPRGATLATRKDGRGITVAVEAPALGGILPGIAIKAEAHAELEPGVDWAGNDAGITARTR